MLAREVNAVPATTDPGWKAVTLPSVTVAAPGSPHTVWYRKTFVLPFSWDGWHVVLHLQGAKFAPQVLLNGKQVGSSKGGLEPAEFELTGLAGGDRNELVIRLQGPPTAKSLTGSPNAAADTTAKWTAPVGAAPEEVGIWDSVWLERRPRVYVSDVRVISSVREPSFQARVTLQSLGLQRRGRQSANAGGLQRHRDGDRAGAGHELD